jgi:hypothetical protein
MNTWEAVDMLDRLGSTEAARVLRDTVGKLEADARALWAVRVLDAWASKPGLCWKLECSHGSYRVTHWSAYDSEHGLLGGGPTPDSARIAAAKALMAEDPSLGHGCDLL